MSERASPAQTTTGLYPVRRHPAKESAAFSCHSSRRRRRRRRLPTRCWLAEYLTLDHFEMWWFQQGLSFLPSALVICSSAAFVFPYVLGVLFYHVDPLVPYISDAGVTPPERCLFGIMLCFASFLAIATMYVRYKQVSALNPEEPKMLRLNKAGLVIGMVSCFGVCIIANFQKNAIYLIHAFGAFLTFGIGVIYILVQTIISYKMQPHIHGKDIFWIRFTILLCCTVSIVSMAISALILLNLSGIDSLRRQHWNPQEKGYVFHIITAVSEWSLAFTFVSFFLTFIRDFQKISLHMETRLFGPNLYHAQEQLLENEQGIPITGSI